MDNLLKMNCFSSLYRAIFYEEYKFWSSLIVHTANFEWWRWWWLQSRCTYILKKILPRASIDYMWLWSLKLIIGNGSQDVFIEVVDLSYLQYSVITWRALVCVVWFNMFTQYSCMITKLDWNSFGSNKDSFYLLFLSWENSNLPQEDIRFSLVSDL